MKTIYYSALLAAGTSLGVIAALYSPSSLETRLDELHTEQALAELDAGSTTYQLADPLKHRIAAPGIKPNSNPFFQENIGLKPPRKPSVMELKVESGDTLDGLLRKANADSEFLNFMASSPDAREFARIKPGQVVKVTMNSEGQISQVNYPRKIYPGSTESMELVASRSDDGFEVKKIKTPFQNREIVAQGRIQSSLYGATAAAGLSDHLAIELTEILSGVIDFHKDIQPGDTFKVVYNQYYLGNKPVTQGNIKYIEFDVGGTIHRAAAYASDSGRIAYYDENGNSLKKAFLRSPLKFSRITSGFTLARFHPIQKRWKAHTGVDYGAPTGTPIMTTGAGTISYVGEKGGYGKTVIVSHGGGRSTLYAHLSAYGRFKAGQKVDQGDVIGKVGATGWATGPHLHYEFRINGKPVNPLSQKVPKQVPLEGADKKKFLRQFAALSTRVSEQVALLDS